MNNLTVWTEPREHGQTLMQLLFSRLDGTYPGMWSGKFADAQAIKNWSDTWSEAFNEDGITPEEIRVALKRLQRLGGFPPSLPEFLAACRPPIDYDKSFFEAVQQMGVRRRPKPTVIDGEVKYIFGADYWSNPAVYWAAIAMGKDLDGEFHKMRSRWHYELDNVLQSGNIRPVPKNTNLIAEPAPSKTMTPEEEKNVTNAIKSVLSMFDAPPEPKPEVNNTQAKQRLQQAMEKLKHEHD